MTLTVEESSPKIFAASLIFKKQPKVDNHPIGKNSPNPVTLKTEKCSIKANITTIHK
jgi:hypothetical protein